MSPKAAEMFKFQDICGESTRMYRFTTESYGLTNPILTFKTVIKGN